MKGTKTTKYHLPNDGELGSSITASGLRRASKETQKEVMRAWFYSQYQDPVHCCPYNSAEGGYQFIYGGPYDAQEELEAEFDGVANPEVIAELADELSDEGAEWSGYDDSSGMEDYIFESLAASTGHLGEFERSISDIRTLLDAPIEGAPQQCLLKLLYVNVITALEAYLSDFFSSAITEHTTLRRKFVKTNPDFVREKISVSEIFEIWEGIDTKVNQYLVDVVWHHLHRVKPMFQAALGVVFPKEMDELFKAILVRHDLVHRNGRKKDGGEHVLERKDIETLIETASSLVSDIEAQWLTARPPEHAGQAAE
jgi:hypothetical protein